MSKSKAEKNGKTASQKPKEKMEFGEYCRYLSEQVKKDPQIGLDFFVRAGILTKSGKLTKRYRH